MILANVSRGHTATTSYWPTLTRLWPIESYNKILNPAYYGLEDSANARNISKGIAYNAALFAALPTALGAARSLTSCHACYSIYIQAGSPRGGFAFPRKLSASGCPPQAQSHHRAGWFSMFVVYFCDWAQGA